MLKLKIGWILLTYTKNKMEYTYKETVPSKVKETKYNLSPCLKCGSENIKLSEYDDKYGYISTALCLGCKKELRTNTTLPCLIEKWNKQNNIDTVIQTTQELIESSKQKIKDLKMLKKKRLKEQVDGKEKRNRTL